MEYDLETKVRVLDRIQEETQKDVANDEGISRRIIGHWKKAEAEIRKEWKRVQLKETVALEPVDNGMVAQKEKEYLKKLDDLGALEERKKVYVAGLEKVMFDSLEALDNSDKSEVKPEVLAKMIKDMNEIREKLSGEPSVIMEYRYKYQMVVMEVVKDMIPERADEFLEKVKRMEDVE